ncbi:hypothetical protein ZIOFF_056895 [Zingiber officinale]|uniref:Nitrate regulatory gene2 protein n=1 Tax=Zingiber officinale TaxID=94328 RepID=A0A8J5FPD7_ZINOF|nr:hypothetical protein ZIOFF_056895 [Zingiber officinale]
MDFILVVKAVLQVSVESFGKVQTIRSPSSSTYFLLCFVFFLIIPALREEIRCRNGELLKQISSSFLRLAKLWFQSETFLDSLEEMGCSASRLEDEEAVQLCRDRRNFIKQAVEQRNRFASGHIAYIQSLKRVSDALCNFVDVDEQPDTFPDTFTLPPFMPVKKLSPEMLGIPFNQYEKKMGDPFNSASQINQSQGSIFHVSRYLRSGANPSVSIEEFPQPSETVRINTYYPMEPYGNDTFFTTQVSPWHSSFYSSTYDRPNYPPASPQNPQWDSFWNPFSSIDTYGYAYQSSSADSINDDDVAGLRQVRQEEGIPELEEEGTTREDDEPLQIKTQKEACEVSSNDTRMSSTCVDSSAAKCIGVNKFHNKQVDNVEVSETKDAIKLKTTREKELAVKRKSAEETHGFTVYLNRRTKGMPEIMKDIESQFLRICDCAHEVSVLLNASKSHYASTSTEIAVKMMNPIALFRSASSRSSSSRLCNAFPSSGCDGYDSSIDCLEESCTTSGNHQSTLDRLYEWEKKLYEEVKAGERIRIAFERKYKQMRSQDMHSKEPSSVDKTRAVVRDLHTQLKVSIHSVESVSRRIETLRDEELHPQLFELVQGEKNTVDSVRVKADEAVSKSNHVRLICPLSSSPRRIAKMWRTTADCHQIQKRTIEEAKLLMLSAAVAAGKVTEEAHPPSPRRARSAAALEADLRNWRACLEIWVEAQRAYARALAGWALRCSDRGDGDRGCARSPLSPPRSSTGGAPPALGVCAQWSRLLESVGEAQAVDGLDFFAAGIASVREMETTAAAAEEDIEGEEDKCRRTPATSEMARRVLCAGMSVAVGSLADFAARSAEGYQVLVRGRDGRAEP